MEIGPDFFHDNRIVKDAFLALSKRTKSFKNIKLMEFCGTHTYNIFNFGFRHAFKPNISFISGPGCPVCVTSEEELYQAFDLITNHNVGVIVYGDLLRVPVGGRSLADLRADGTVVEMVYSALDALTVARERSQMEWVFLGIGFETTIPGTAAAVDLANKEGIKNLSFLSFHKNTRSILSVLGKLGKLYADGIILPGHVSAVVGSDYFLAVNDFGLPSVVMGFEPLDILVGTNLLLDMIEKNEQGIRCAYKRAVDEKGNRRMMDKVNEVFYLKDTPWRGLGLIDDGGYEIRDNYKNLNARIRFGIPEKYPIVKKSGCRCGDVLIGKIDPLGCPLFGNKCVPENPVGPCMVSHEGTCLAYYKWGRNVE